MKRNLRTILTVFRQRRYKLFQRPYELNLVGIRSDSVIPNAFDDRIAVIFRDERGRWNYFDYPATTDPGTYWLDNPPAMINSMGLKGTAILKQGQWLNIYKIDTHRRGLPGAHEALCQRGGEITVIRDYNRDAVLDFWNGVETTGWYGINIHRPSAGGDNIVNRDSAGCQVFRHREDFYEVMEMARRHRDRYGNSFTYTLVDLRAMRKARLRRWAIGGGIVLGSALLIGGGYWLYQNQKSSAA